MAAMLAGSVAWTQVPDGVLTLQKKAAIVARVAGEFRAQYVFQDLAEQMAAALESKLRSGEYDALDTLAAFNARIEADIQSILHDKHIKVRPGPAPVEFDDPHVLRRENFGFKAVEILPGNIGYLSFFQFYHPKLAGPTAIAAMNFLAHCSALIIDLRENGGGYPEMRTLLASYFFDRRVPLIEFRNSRGVLWRDFSQMKVTGPKLVHVPVYILVGRPTFSCAEDFAFCMQNRKRATIIGEKTGGGAHGNKIISCPNESIWLQLPFNEAVDPVSKKTWEQVGVQPDIMVPFDMARHVAMIEACKTLLLSGSGDNDLRQTWQWMKEDAEARLAPVVSDLTKLDDDLGVYGAYAIARDGSRLVMRPKDRSRMLLVPLGKDLFRLELQDNRFDLEQRVRFNRDGNGQVKELQILWNDGAVDVPIKKEAP